ncbi:MAG TPA: AI-2E family transporter [Steroidobacteraceae bacterium]|jgi:predicted PurR-regulated permease PerM|nr:AI-2E family transporter [Steroidobacteraceae bacterium]
MQPYSYAPARLSATAYLLAAIGLSLVLALHLLPAMFVGLLVYAVVSTLASGMQRYLPGERAHWLVVALLAAVVVGTITLAIAGAIAFLNTELGNPTLFFQRMTPLIERARTQLPAIIVNHLPDNSDELRATVIEWVRMHVAQLQLAGKQAVRAIVQLLVGMVLGAMLAFYNARLRPAGGPLTVVLKARCANLAIAFRDVVFAQTKISALNTLLTGIFLFILLPLFGVHLPLAKTLVITTFVVGLLPVIGNLISNTLIFVVALSISLWVALAAVTFLIIIHKLEYFLSARIIGTQIQARAWELLIAMLLMETLFGISGLIAAPIYYAYLKRELAGVRLI